MPGGQWRYLTFRWNKFNMIDKKEWIDTLQFFGPGLLVKNVIHVDINIWIVIENIITSTIRFLNMNLAVYLLDIFMQFDWHPLMNFDINLFRHSIMNKNKVVSVKFNILIHHTYKMILLRPSFGGTSIVRYQLKKFKIMNFSLARTSVV